MFAMTSVPTSWWTSLVVARKRESSPCHVPVLGARNLLIVDLDIRYGTVNATAIGMRWSDMATGNEGERAMKRSLSLALGVLLMLAFLAHPMGGTAAFQAGAYCADSEESALLTLINEYRAENGLNPLVLSQTLSEAADAHSRDMADNNFMSHDGSNGSQPQDRLQDHGYTSFSMFAENIFGGEKDAAAAFAWWKSSPGHNANMLNPSLGAIGIGRAGNPDTETGWFWTTTFGDKVDAAACVEGGIAVDPPADETPAQDDEDGVIPPAGNANSTDTDVAPDDQDTSTSGDDSNDQDTETSDDGSDDPATATPTRMIPPTKTLVAATKMPTTKALILAA